MKKYALKEEEFQGLLAYRDWEIKEISFDDIQRLLHVPRRNDVVAIFASGDMIATKVLNGIESVFGMDVIVHETRPKTEKNEPELNIYHCVIQKLKNPINGYGYIMHGPSESETLFGHWKDVSVLDDYIKLTEWKE
jgi:hypothetical protein